MENEKNESIEETTNDTAIETVEMVNETEEVSNEEAAAPEEPKVVLSPEEQIYEDLKVERMGKFTVGMAYGDATYYRNLLDKSSYKGPQQAYLLIVAKSELSQVCEGLKEQDKTQRYEVELTSACIESVGFFMNNCEGKGSDSATKLFTASMLMRPAMGLINELDAKLEEAQKNIATVDKQ